MLNWIVWNRTIYMYKMDLAWITYNGWCAIKPNQIKLNQTIFNDGYGHLPIKYKVYIYKRKHLVKR